MINIDRFRTFTAKDITRIDDLYDALTALASEIQRIINAYQLDAQSLRELGQDLARLRYLISVLPMEDERLPGRGKALLALFLELEGFIKELRNERTEP